MILQTIKQREEVFDKEFFDVETELGTDIPIYNQLPAIKSFHRQSIIAVLKAEIEWLEGEKKVERVCAYCHDSGFMRVVEGKHKIRKCVWCAEGKDKLDSDQLVSLHNSFNQALDHTITHLTQIIKELEVWY